MEKKFRNMLAGKANSLADLVYYLSSQLDCRSFLYFRLIYRPSGNRNSCYTTKPPTSIYCSSYIALCSGHTDNKEKTYIFRYGL